MQIVVRYAYCTASGRITQNVFASPADAENWASMMSQADSGTLYMREESCWIPVMVFGLADDDVSVLARGMAFVAAVDGADYAQAMEDYLGCEDIPESIKDDLRREIVGRAP